MSFSSVFRSAFPADTNSSPSSRMSRLTFFLNLGETYTRTPLSFPFFLVMALIVQHSSRSAVVVHFLLDLLYVLGRL